MILSWLETCLSFLKTNFGINFKSINKFILEWATLDRSLAHSEQAVSVVRAKPTASKPPAAGARRSPPPDDGDNVAYADAVSALELIMEEIEGVVGINAPDSPDQLRAEGDRDGSEADSHDDVPQILPPPAPVGGPSSPASSPDSAPCTPDSACSPRSSLQAGSTAAGS